jgi:hypothetical protein
LGGGRQTLASRDSAMNRGWLANTVPVSATKRLENTMKKLLTRLPLGIAALILVSTSPVQAEKPEPKPISGKIGLTLNLFPCPEEGPFLTWTGTVVIDGHTYGFADAPFPVEGAPPPNDKFFSFEEHWTIFDLEDGEDPNQAPLLACDDSRVVLEGVNTGWATPGWAARADGEVTEAADPGPFASVEPGSRMIWRGKILGYSASAPPPAPGSEFKATLHISAAV